MISVNKRAVASFAQMSTMSWFSQLPHDRGAQQPADVRTDCYPVAVAYYNVGVHNNEVHSKNWDNNIVPLCHDLPEDSFTMNSIGSTPC